MKKSDENIQKLQLENAEMEIEHDKKQRILKVLREKAKRIEKQRTAVQKYHDFLEEVRLNNPDQYGSIMAIIDRHKTLQELQLKLKNELQRKENDLNAKRNYLIQFENDKSTLIMQLNNEIANLKKKSELIDDERNKLKNQEQENSTQQFEKITQLSRILMAIDHLEGFCKYKKLKFDRAEAVVGLNYDAVNMQNDKDKKENFEEIINKGQFNSYSDRTEVALSQITMIG